MTKVATERYASRRKKQNNFSGYAHRSLFDNPQQEDHVIRASNHFTPCGARTRDLWLIGPSLQPLS
jgi:hypothetical protein